MTTKNTLELHPADTHCCKDYNCTASPQAVLLLEKAGFTNVMDFDGGIEAWTQNNYPLTSDTSYVGRSAQRSR